MATLTGSTIASSYEQLLSLPDGGGDAATPSNLVAVTDGDAGTTFAMQLSTTTLCVDNPTASSSTQGGILRLQSDDGDVMASGHRLGVIEFGGAETDGNVITTGARIEAITDATWSTTENGAYLSFYTTDANASQTEGMRLNAASSLSIANDLTLSSDACVLNFGAGNDVTFTHDNGTGMNVASAGDFDIAVSAGDATFTVADTKTLILGQTGASELKLSPSNTAGSELASLINTAGTTDGSDAAGSILLSAVAGGMSLAWNDAKDLWAEGGSAIVTANEDAAGCIKLHADAGTSQTILIQNDAGTADGAVNIAADAGGITLDAGTDIIFNVGATGSIYSTGDGGTSNTIYGANAGNTIASGGNKNVCIGDEAGTAITTGDNNTLVGYAAGDALVGMTDNTAVGYNALTGSSLVDSTVVIGSGAGAGAMTDAADGAIAIGKAAGAAITTGARITALGFEAADVLTVGDDNLAIGYQAMSALSTTDGSDKNIAIGNYAMDGVSTLAATNNVFIGYGSGGGSWTGTLSQRNVALGNNTLGGAMDSAVDIVAIGYNAGAAITTGLTNVLVGSNAGASLTTGNTSIAIGNLAMSTHTTGNTNIAIGYNAMDDTDAGSTSLDAGGNIFIGTNSGGGTWADADNTGNVCLGGNTMNGALSTAQSNTCIGPSAGNDMVYNDYCVALGYNAQASANNATQEITLGDGNIETLRCEETSITGLSDQRDKTDVEDYPSSGGLNFINKLRPVLFTWDRRQWYGEPDEEYNEENDFPEGHVRENVLGTPDGSKKSAVKDAEHPHGGARMGFLAQELDSAIDEVDAEFMKNMDMVYKSNPDKLETKLGHLITPLIKAVQELSAKVTALENA